MAKYINLTRFIYISLSALLICAFLLLLDQKQQLYSLNSKVTKNEILIRKKQEEVNNQKVIINNLSSKERLTEVANTLGMRQHKNVKRIDKNLASQ